MEKSSYLKTCIQAFGLCIVLGILLSYTKCFGNSERSISQHTTYSFGRPDYIILYDASASLSIEQVARLDISKFNLTIEEFHPNLHQNLWLRLDIVVNDYLEGYWIFEFYNQRAEEVILFVQDRPNHFVAIDTIGSSVPFYQRNLHERFPAFEVPLKAGKNILFLKYKSKSYLGLNTTLEPYQTYINFANEYYFVIGGFYFILFILLLYNLLFFISTRDRIYLYYILFVVASALDCLKVDHIGFALFWPNYPGINSYAEDYARTFFIFGIVNYASYFLSLKKDYPTLYFWLWTVFILFVLHQSVLGIVFPHFPFALQITELFIFSMLSILLYVALKRLREGNRPVRIFLVGYASMFIGFVVTYSFYSGWIQGNHLVYYILFYGIVVDTFMFSFALSSRLRQERLEKERALEAENTARGKEIELMHQNEVLLNKVNAELEQKVQERTLEIEASKQKLAEQAAIIDQMNSNLHKENWSLNKTIKSLSIKKVMPENLSYSQIQELFPTETECYHFLANIKWQNGFYCKKCGNTKVAATNDFYSRRCSR